LNIIHKRKFLKTNLKETLVLLENSFKALSYSYDKCLAIGEKSNYDLEEQESFEALTSRFARTSDILTHKAFKTLFAILQENVKTIIDAANLAEKLEIVENADDILNIRELRNQIAHEYINADLTTLFMDVLRYVPEIKIVIENFESYVNKELDKVSE
jgi:uncharacterized protein with HEPN domain